MSVCLDLLSSGLLAGYTVGDSVSTVPSGFVLCQCCGRARRDDKWAWSHVRCALNTINLSLKMAEKVEDLNLPASSINRIVREAVS